MKTLSVIIVSYNVKYFLYQTLLSLKQALAGIDSEVFVVDNDSADGTAELVKSNFPEVRFISNSENVGFAKANNQAFMLTDSEFVLLLNPDTILKSDTIKVCLEEMVNNPKLGAMGVKMIDGKGGFLPESKRGLPTPWVSLCKIIGLTGLFPKSSLFSKYYLGELPTDQANYIEVLTGAFMFVKSSVYREVGMLDETYFMYGEDIDFSYQITQKGYKILYQPRTQIVHYKGESTKKRSLRFIKSFHDAMIIFYHKNFKKGKYGVTRILIEFIIEAKAFLEKLKLKLPLKELPKKTLRNRKEWFLVGKTQEETLEKFRDFLRTTQESIVLEQIEVSDLGFKLKQAQQSPHKEPKNVVFPVNEIGFGTAIDSMQAHSNEHVHFWNLLPNGTLLGSHSKNENGEVYFWDNLSVSC